MLPHDYALPDEVLKLIRSAQDSGRVTAVTKTAANNTPLEISIVSGTSPTHELLSDIDPIVLLDNISVRGYVCVPDEHIDTSSPWINIPVSKVIHGTHRAARAKLVTALVYQDIVPDAWIQSIDGCLCVVKGDFKPLDLDYLINCLLKGEINPMLHLDISDSYYNCKLYDLYNDSINGTISNEVMYMLEVIRSFVPAPATPPDLIRSFIESTKNTLNTSGRNMSNPPLPSKGK